MGAGDYLHLQFQNRRKIADLIVKADMGSQTDLLTAKSENHRIYIQRIVVSPTTYMSRTWTFQDDSPIPLEIAHLAIPTRAPSASGTIEWNFGPAGTPLSLGKGLDLAISSPGVAGIVHIEGYEKQVPVTVC